MNKKGQALIEFIIIMPIFIMILLAAFDLVQIFTVKMDLENQMESLVLEEKNPHEDIKLTKIAEENLVIYKLSKDVDITSPFVTMFIDNKYEVTVERTLYHE